MYEDQFGEFVCGYWGLKGLYETDTSFNIQTPSKKLEMRCCQTF